MSNVNTLRQTLVEARGFIALPEKWTKGALSCDGKVCSLGAIYKAVTGEPTDSGRQGEQRELIMAAAATLTEAFGRAVTDRRDFSDCTEHVWLFNDNEATTHEEVLAGFDKAIEALPEFETTITKVTTETKTLPYAKGDVFRYTNGDYSVLYEVLEVDPTRDKDPLRCRDAASDGRGQWYPTHSFDSYTHLQNGVKETSADVEITRESAVVQHRFQVGDIIAEDAYPSRWEVTAIEWNTNAWQEDAVGAYRIREAGSHKRGSLFPIGKRYPIDKLYSLVGGPRFVEPPKWEVGQWLQGTATYSGGSADRFTLKVLAWDPEREWYDGNGKGMYEVTGGTYGYQEGDSAYERSLGWFTRKHIEGDFEAFTPPPPAPKVTTYTFTITHEVDDYSQIGTLGRVIEDAVKQSPMLCHQEAAWTVEGTSSSGYEYKQGALV